MPQRFYVGPRDEVEIAATGQVVRHGEAVEVSAELAELLDAQPSNWAAKSKPKNSPSTTEGE